MSPGRTAEPPSPRSSHPGGVDLRRLPSPARSPFLVFMARLAPKGTLEDWLTPVRGRTRGCRWASFRGGRSGRPLVVEEQRGHQPGDAARVPELLGHRCSRDWQVNPAPLGVLPLPGEVLCRVSRPSGHGDGPRGVRTHPAPACRESCHYGSITAAQGSLCLSRSGPVWGAAGPQYLPSVGV